MLVKTIRKAIVSIVLVISLFSIAQMASSLSNLKIEFENSARKLIKEHAQREANRVSSSLNQDLAIARTLSNVMEGIANYPTEKRESIQRLVMKEVLRDNPEYMAVFLSWSLQHIDSTWIRSNGRQRFNQYFSNGKIVESINLTDTAESIELHGLFYEVKELGQGILSNPYLFEAYDNASQELLLATSPCYPINVEGQFVGVIGLDISLDYYTKLSEVNLYENSYAILFSNDGKIISHPNQKWENTLLNDLDYLKSENDLLSMIQNGSDHLFTSYDTYLGEEVMVGIAPINVKDGSPWSVAIVVPDSAIMAPLKKRIMIMAIIMTLVIVLIAFSTQKIGMVLVRSLDKANQRLKNLAHGDLSIKNEIQLNRLDKNLEIGNSVNILMRELRKKSDFSQEIGKGNLNAELKKASDEDLLGHSLLSMRNNLQQAINDTQEALKFATREGRLDVKVKTDGKKGAWLDLSSSINQLLQSIWQPLEEVNKVIEDMAAGDLRSRYISKSDGEVHHLAQNLNHALDELNELINRVKLITLNVRNSANEMILTSEEMTNSSSEIASAIAQISSGAQEQVNKVDKSSQLIENLFDSSENIGKQSNIITNAAEIVNKRSKYGLKMVNNILQSMNDVSQLSKRSENAIKVLEDRSNDISNILEFITGIADQTNLLALNAAIEAAQAGESGRGFAVIAEEIRKLAENSRGSVNEIKSLVTFVQQNTKEVSNSIGEMKSKVEKSHEISQITSEEFKGISEASENNLSLAKEILEMTQDQSKNIKEIVSISEAVVVIAEQSAAGTEEAASASEEVSSGMSSYLKKNQQLAIITQNLQEKLDQFKVVSNEASSFKEIG
jgi:methyl-accepting chemotaxis protein